MEIGHKMIEAVLSGVSPREAFLQEAQKIRRGETITLLRYLGRNSSFPNEPPVAVGDVLHGRASKESSGKGLIEFTVDAGAIRGAQFAYALSGEADQRAFMKNAEFMAKVTDVFKDEITIEVF